MLVAAEDGWYPIYRRGVPGPVGHQLLKKGEVWKIGKTINPATRYSKAWLDRNKLRYRRQFRGTEAEALQEKYLRIVEYETRCGYLPPGNKVRR